jgi:hypothetical protein
MEKWQKEIRRLVALVSINYFITLLKNPLQIKFMAEANFQKAKSSPRGVEEGNLEIRLVFLARKTM